MARLLVLLLLGVVCGATGVDGRRQPAPAHWPLRRVGGDPPPVERATWLVAPPPPSAEVDAAKYEALRRSVATPKSKPASKKKAKAKAAPATTQTKVVFITVFGERLGFGAFVIALLVLAFVIMAAQVHQG